MEEEKKLILPHEFVEEIPEAAAEFLQPHLRAIYDEKPDQIGTGFLTIWNDKPLLVTAKHVLFGQKFNEEPLKKSIFVGDSLTTIGELANSEIFEDQELDVAIFHIKNVPLSQCLPYTCLKMESTPPEALCIMGFLERDFKRSRADGTLQPKPYLFQGMTKHLDNKHIGMTYLGRARTTKTKAVELAPIPRGLSGTMMVNLTGLLRNQVEVFGVFTDECLDKGYVFGSHINALQPLLEKLD